jgi:molecular chaperone GrpE (heat shock protein)
MSSWDKIALGVKPINRVARNVVKRDENSTDGQRIAELESENLRLKQEIQMLYAEVNFAHDSTLKAVKMAAKFAKHAKL